MKISKLRIMFSSICIGVFICSSIVVYSLSSTPQGPSLGCDGCAVCSDQSKNTGTCKACLDGEYECISSWGPRHCCN